MDGPDTSAGTSKNEKINKGQLAIYATPSPHPSQSLGLNNKDFSNWEQLSAKITPIVLGQENQSEKHLQQGSQKHLEMTYSPAPTQATMSPSQLFHIQPYP
ncbi:unnamed protein product [Leuciscus chuanchicus]